MSKETKGNIFSVIANGIKIYFSNIDKFFMYMLFPVFGQLIGICLALAFPVMFAHKIINKTNSISMSFLFVVLLAIPGLLILMKAFWDYMVAYVALNSMTEGAVTTGKVYDIPAHNAVATRQIFKYIGFLIVVSVLISIGTTPFCIVPATIVWIYFILVFQVFTFEPNLSIKECFKKSFKLVKGNWLPTFILMITLVFFSIFIITQGLTVVFDYLNITSDIRGMFNFIGKSLPLDKINEYLVIFKLEPITVKTISNWVFLTLITFIISGLTLPIRSICYSLWYKVLSDKLEIKEYEAKTTTSKKRKKAEA